MAATVSWDPNRYGSTKQVLEYNSTTGTYSVVDQDHDYTGINYNFSSLPSSNTQTTNTQTTNTQTNTAQTESITDQTAKAFGDVTPWWWNTEGEGGGSGMDESTMFKKQTSPTEVSGFFKPLGDAIEGNKPNLGTRLRHQFADVTGKTDREWGQVDKDIRMDQIQTDLSSGRLDNEEEQALRAELSDLQQSSFFKKPIGAIKAGGSGISRFVKKAVPESVKSKWSKFKPLALRAIDAVVPEETPVQKMHKRIFAVDETGRIAGNPAEDLYAGMNRVSAYGNLERAGEKRISTREKTIERKGYKPGDKFYDDTQRMKKQQENYKNEKDNTVETGYTRTRAERKANPGRQDREGGSNGGSGGSDSGKIVCTMMNESYGFGLFRNKIWMKFHKDIAPEYQQGYHKLFLPLVHYAKQKGITNKIIKKTLEHIAIHSTIDMRQSLRGKKHLLGRIYRKIILPLCYWAGKK